MCSEQKVPEHQGRASPHLNLANPRMILAPLGVVEGFFALWNGAETRDSQVKAVM
jgi:hypothetical protein